VTRCDIAVVTGAGRARGIGRAACLRLAEDGSRVVVVERSSDASSLTPTEVEQGWTGAASVARESVAAGGQAWARACDVAIDDDVRDLVNDVAELGPISVLVNNASTPGEASKYRIHETDPRLWDQTLSINVTSIYRMVRHIVPVMSSGEPRNRSIINLSSTAGLRALPYYGAYPASKAAVNSVTVQLALELARFGIRVNAVSPGSTDTDQMDGTFERAAERVHGAAADVRTLTIKRIPLRRQGTPRDQAEVIGFLAGPKSSYITGQVIQVDGGLSLV
jgi:NAD(P)-dependent dehydrogenase (short-subunit alcohol dehydrogenase family)